MKKIILILAVLFLITGCKSQSFKFIDETQDEHLLAVGQAFESFYEDDKYIYYWSTMINSYMKVEFEDGTVKLISDALKDGSITIKDLDKAGISYTKERKQKDY